MDYAYGKFSNNQIQVNSKLMHSEIHKLLLYKDNNVKQEIFNNEKDFFNYFHNLLCRFGGLNELLYCPVEMVGLMATLQAAYDLVQSDSYDYSEYRRLILDAHAYIQNMFSAESEDINA